MLDVALEFLVKNVNAWLALRTGTDFGKLELSHIVDDSGKWMITKEHIGVALINVEEERVLKSQLPDTTLVNGRNVILQPELKLNLHVLFAANFTRYDQALRYIALVLTYFQAHVLFKGGEYPGLDSRIEKLSTELQSLSYEQLNQVWAVVGSKQLPSMIYKVRMVALQDREPSAIGAPIVAGHLDVHQS
jgi:hypothetical protein